MAEGAKVFLFLRSRYLFDRLFIFFTVCIGGLSLFVFIYFFISLLTSKKIQIYSESGNALSKNFDLQKILTGPLMLKENTLSPLAISLEQKLVLLAQSVRPDMGKGEKAFRIGVRGSEKQKVIKEGEVIFCKLTQQQAGAIENLEFVDEATGTFMVPHVLDGRSLLLKVKKPDGENFEITLQATQETREGIGAQDATYYLKGAKWWGQDLFFFEYGKDQYHLLGQKNKLEFFDGKSPYFLYIKEGDFLTFENGKWHILSSLNEANRSSPLAHVFALDHRELEIEVWDQEGFSVFHKKWIPEKVAPCRIAMDHVIIDAKLRTTNQVTGKIGKKRWIFKPGDWLIKTQTGWHKLKTAEEIDAYLNHQLKGELFVIDSVNSGGKMQGHYFDEMRVQMQTFALNVSSSKSNKMKKRIGSKS